MEGFFSGTVVILYFLSRYAAEYIFVAACFLPALCGFAMMLVLRLGSAGGMIAAWRRSKPFRMAKVVAAGERDRFFTRCVKRTSPAFRASYALFLEGKISSAALSSTGVRSVSARRGLAVGVAGVGLLSALLVFLTFYFLVPIGETVLRTAVCAFHAALGAVSFRFLSCAYVARAEKAAVRFSASLDELILRPKAAPPISRPEDDPICDGGTTRLPRGKGVLARSRYDEVKTRTAEDGELAALRSLLRDLDSPPSA